MSTEKRPRGRPHGSGKDDSRYLEQVADLLVRDHSLKPTTAMKRIMLGRKDWGATDATLLRRWQVKWRAKEGSLLAAARERARPKPVVYASNYATPRSSPPSIKDFLDPLRAVREHEQCMRDLIDTPWMQAIRDAQTIVESDPIWKSIKEASKAIESDPFWSRIRNVQKVTESDRFRGSALEAFFDPLPLRHDPWPSSALRGFLNPPKDRKW
jgi:hypothetical protein